MNERITSARGGPRGRRLVLVSLGLTGLAIAATAGTSAAHNPNATASCTGLSLSLTQYEGPSTNNTVTVTIDGATTTVPFGEGLSRSFSWSDAADHTWSVAVDANREAGDTTAYDWSTSGAQRACVTTTTESATTTSPPPPETSPAPTTAPTLAPLPTDAPTLAAATPAAPAIAAAPSSASTSTTVGIADEAMVVSAQPPATGARASVAATGPSANTLPRTGSNTGAQLAVAIAALLIGAAMITLARRRTTTS